ncbi:MAG: type 1 glutamine amidotransferase [Planctomycetota bacterium]
MRILLLQNHELCDADLMGTALRRRGVPCTVAAAFQTERLPDVADFDALLVLGSPASCRDIDQDPGLMNARGLVARAVALEKPTLGICFGGQILAQVLGAQVRQSDTGEFGTCEIHLTDEGVRSPLFVGFPATLPTAQFHSDTFELPPGATLLASSATCRNQAFVLGRSVGMQFHPEASATRVAEWARMFPDGPASLGKSVDDVAAECRATEVDRVELCDLLTENFLKFARG